MGQIGSAPIPDGSQTFWTRHMEANEEGVHAPPALKPDSRKQVYDPTTLLRGVDFTVPLVKRIDVPRQDSSDSEGHDDDVDADSPELLHCTPDPRIRLLAHAAMSQVGHFDELPLGEPELTPTPQGRNTASQPMRLTPSDGAVTEAARISPGVVGQANRPPWKAHKPPPGAQHLSSCHGFDADFGTSVVSQSVFSHSDFRRPGPDDSTASSDGSALFDMPAGGGAVVVEHEATSMRDILLLDQLLSASERHLLLQARDAQKARDQATAAGRAGHPVGRNDNGVLQTQTSLSRIPDVHSTAPPVRDIAGRGIPSSRYAATPTDDDGLARISPIARDGVVHGSAGGAQDEFVDALGLDDVAIDIDQSVSEHVVEQHSRRFASPPTESTDPPVQPNTAHGAAADGTVLTDGTADADTTLQDGDSVGTAMRQWLRSGDWMVTLLDTAMVELELEVTPRYYALPVLANIMNRSHAVQGELQRRLNRDPMAAAPLVEALVSFIRHHIDSAQGSPRVRYCGGIEHAVTVLSLVARDLRGAGLAPLLRNATRYLLNPDDSTTAADVASALVASATFAAAWATLAVYTAVGHSDGSFAIKVCDDLAHSLCPLGASDGVRGGAIAAAVDSAAASQEDVARGSTAKHNAAGVWGVADANADASQRVARSLPSFSTVSGGIGKATKDAPGTLDLDAYDAVVPADAQWDSIVHSAAALSPCLRAPSGSTIVHLAFAYLLAIARRDGYTSRAKVHESHYRVLIPVVSSAEQMMDDQCRQQALSRIASWLQRLPRMAQWLHLPRFAPDGHFSSLLAAACSANAEVEHGPGGVAAQSLQWRWIVQRLFSGNIEGHGSSADREELQAMGSGDGIVAYSRMLEQEDGHPCDCGSIDVA